MSDKQYRLVTRSDLDGLVSAVLLKQLNLINDIKFVHPKDVQDGILELTENDITTNLPYSNKVYLSFDHHQSEFARLEGKMPKNYIADPKAPSAAEVVFKYYGGEKTFKNLPKGIMEGVNKADSAQFTQDDVLNPAGWTFLSFITDPRTGLGRFHNFRISNYNLMMELINIASGVTTVEDILKHPDVQERIDIYMKYAENAKEQIQRCSKIYDHIVVFDPRNEEEIWPTNRFMIYALYPETSVSIHVMWGLKKQNTVLAVGKSIFNRSSKTNIGDLMLKFNGGGHVAAGTCQLDNDNYEEGLNQIIQGILADG